MTTNLVGKTGKNKRTSKTKTLGYNTGTVKETRFGIWIPALTSHNTIGTGHNPIGMLEIGAVTNWKHYWKYDFRIKDSEDRDRPYVSHLDFPSFTGNTADFANYRYTAMNLKSQCGPTDYK